MQQAQQDPRATVIKNLSQEQQILEQVIKQIPSLSEITFDLLIDLFEKCFELREEPEFIEALFGKQELYDEFVGWILEPVRMIEKRKLEGKQPKGDWQHKYPSTCVKIAKDNNLFYIHLYLKAYFDQTALRKWFSFLSQPGQQQTLYTSLGYMTEVLMPFIKYDFSDCTKICEELLESCDEDMLVSSSVIQREETPVSKEREMIETKKKQSYLQKQISILTLFSDGLLAEIMGFIQHEAVFKFLHNLILVSLEEVDLKRSKRIFEAFLKKALDIEQRQQIQQTAHQKIADLSKKGEMDVCCEYILQIFKQIYDNANTQKNYRVIFFIDSVVRLNVITIFIERIQQSPLMAKESPQQKLSASSDFTSIISEEQVLEYYIKSLTYLVKIFAKMSRAKRTDEDRLRESKFYCSKELSGSGGKLQAPDSVNGEGEEEVSGENKVMREFSYQLNEIFTKLPSLSQLVKKSQSRSTPFSSGQNIKPITLCKYEFFQLLYNCLLLSKQFPQSFVLDTEKINIFSIIELQRYLQENRWNNLAHKVLEKIACLLIVNNKSFYRTKEMNKNNMADEFLNTIIEYFTNRKHIFLNSLRFTSQGNLHTLYTIAKAIISKLKQSHTLANFVHELDYYKKFVMQDLQSYQKRIKQIQYPASKQDLRASDKEQNSDNNSNNDQVKLYVDELSVSEIVKKIEVVNRWPLKDSKKKHGSFIQRSLSSMSEENHKNNSVITERKKVKLLPPSQQLLNTDEEDEENQEISNNRMINTASPRAGIKSDIKDFSKSSEDGSAIFKQSFKRTDSRIEEFGINRHSSPREGTGLFSLGQVDQMQKPAHSGLFKSMEYGDTEQKDSSNNASSINSFLLQNLQKHERKFKSAQKNKHDQEQQNFNLNSPYQNQGELLKINVISSDRKLVKNVSIQEETNMFEDQLEEVKGKISFDKTNKSTE